MSTMFNAIKHAETIINDCMAPDVFPVIGWSDVHLKNASKEVKAAVANGANTIATIRPLMGDIVVYYVSH